MTNEMITKLTDMGATRWTKGDHDRLYLNDAACQIIGLETETYKSGSISSATLNGEKISNREAGRLGYTCCGMWIDLTDDGIHAGREYGQSYEAEDIMEQIQSFISA